MSDPIDTGTPDAAPEGGEENWTVPPVWEKAMAVVPDSLRGDLVAQIRTSEREAQKAIEDARTGSVEPAWRDFVGSAKQAGVSPDTLVESYTLQQQMLADPQAFVKQLSDEIQKLVDSGQMTRAEGAAAKQEVAQGVADQVDLESPEMKELRELKQQFTEMKSGLTAQQQAQQDAYTAQQQEQQAVQYYNDFSQQTLNAFKSRGYDVTPGSPTAVAGETVVAIMRLADSALSGDASGTLTEQQAIQGAFNSMDSFLKSQGGNGLNPVGTAPAANQAPPVGNGRGAAAPEAPQRAGTPNSIAADKQRSAQMMAVAQQMAAAGISDDPFA